MRVDTDDTARSLTLVFYVHASDLARTRSQISDIFVVRRAALCPHNTRSVAIRQFECDLERYA